jgi:nitroreductase
LFAKIVELPENYRVLCFIALGYADEEKAEYTDKNINLSKVHYNSF